MTPLAVPTRTLPDGTLLLLSLVADGLTDREIAAEAGLSVHVVKHRVGYLLRTHGLASRAGAVAMAYREGWFQRVPADPSTLTARQLDIVQMIANGASPQEIYRKLRLRPAGLNSHLTRIFDLTGARNRPHLVRIAVNTGIVPVLGVS